MNTPAKSASRSTSDPVTSDAVPPPVPLEANPDPEVEAYLAGFAHAPDPRDPVESVITPGDVTPAAPGAAAPPEPETPDPSIAPGTYEASYVQGSDIPLSGSVTPAGEAYEYQLGFTGAADTWTTGTQDEAGAMTGGVPTPVEATGLSCTINFRVVSDNALTAASTAFEVTAPGAESEGASEGETSNHRSRSRHGRT